MKFLLVLVIILVRVRADFELTSFLDNFRQSLVWLRQTSMRETKRNMRSLFEENLEAGKLQERIPDNIPFPCNTTNTRSFVRPTNINRLRPGDIDVIASIGDSLTAANGGMSNNILHILNENRAISFSGGGKGTWREILTLPNILKEFNPNLYGYSVDNVLAVEKQSRLNVAEPMVMSRDMNYQANSLIKRMKADKRVNMKEDWKLLTIFVGNNDVCSDMCHHHPQVDFANQHERDLESTLRILRKNVPRLFVQIVPVPNMVELYNMKGSSPLCYLVHAIGCSCIFNHDISVEKLIYMEKVIHDWQQREVDLCKRDEFNTKVCEATRM